MTRGGWQAKDYLWHIRFQLKSEESKCGWKYVSLRVAFNDEEEAKPEPNVKIIFQLLLTKFILRNKQND